MRLKLDKEVRRNEEDKDKQKKKSSVESIV